VKPSEEEDPQEQLLALRELVEGYRESHRAMFRQLRELQVAREEAEASFWSLVARHEPPPDSGEDLFGELTLEPMPPTTQRPALEQLTLELHTLRDELDVLRHKNLTLSEQNHQLRRKLEAQKPAYLPPDTAMIEAIRRDTREAVVQEYTAELARKNRDLSAKTAELIRTSDQLRRTAVDLELARGQIKEDTEELGVLRKRLEGANQLVERLQAQLHRGVHHGRQEALEGQLIEWTDKAQALDRELREARSALVELQLLALRAVITLGHGGSPRVDLLRDAYRGLQQVFASDTPPDEALKPLLRHIFPFPDQPSQPHYEAEDAPIDTEESAVGAFEDVGEEELLPPVPPPRSTRPPPLPSSPPPGLETIPDPFAQHPPSSSRTRTAGWSPVAPQPPSRNRTMLGFSASAEQVAEQQRLADELAAKNQRYR
jgi:hypothetical protein